jgi:DNA-binding response OmpR family regulator
MPEDKNSVLIVEDEEAMLKALRDKFAKEGFEVMTAANGEDGLALGLEKRPDLVMLDILMPKMGGLETARRIREDKKWGSQVPILILTNLNDPESVSEAASYQVFDFLVKTDWSLDDIIRLARERLYI